MIRGLIGQYCSGDRDSLDSGNILVIHIRSLSIRAIDAMVLRILWVASHRISNSYMVPIERVIGGD